jgi:hypothetical protein
VSSTVSPVSVRSACTVQRASGVDHAARTTRWPKRMCSSMPASLAVSRTYCRIAGPSAIALASVHGRNR